MSVEELFQSRNQVASDKPSAEVFYLVRGVSDEPAVISSVAGATPTTYAGMPRKSIECSERVNADTWKAVVRYEGVEATEGEEEPEPVFSFDTGGGTQHITQSIETRAKYGPEASDLLGGAIGFDGEQITGVDIAVPVYNFSETHFLSPSTVTAVFRMALFRTTGCVNSGGFRGFAAGEVLFLGASGSRRGTGPDDDWEITYKFAASPNREGISVGGIGGISKQGWDYMWVQYAPDVDDGKKILIKKPVAVYVEKVYPAASFADLGI